MLNQKNDKKKYVGENQPNQRQEYNGGFKWSQKR